MAKAKKTVLIVEDELLKLFLDVIDVAATGLYEIRTAETGYEAVRKTRLYTPDLIIMDLNLPRMSGEEAIEAIRHFNKEVPIIALTAYPHRKDRAMGAGATYYREKPIAVDDLLELLELALKGDSDG